MKRYLVLVACVVMLMCLGTGQAWSVFIPPLVKEYGYSSAQMQMVFAIGQLFFCLGFIVGGRLHDRVGPRPMAVASAVMLAGGWWLSRFGGSHYVWLFVGMGILNGAGAAVGYASPIATAMKWFPRNRGLVTGLMVAGFAGGPIVISVITETCLAKGWAVLDIFGLLGSAYPVIILATGMMLVVPAGGPGLEEVDGFSRRKLLVDRRFWTLFAGMFVGTLPYLVVMGSAKPMAQSFGFEWAALVVVGVVAAGNAVGRIFWGWVVDRVGMRRSMLGAQGVMIGSMAILIAAGRWEAWTFLAAAWGVGFCYGSNFAIYPATVSRLYGTHVLGTVYPLVMAAQGISSVGPTVNGWLRDVSGSYVPGLAVAAMVAAVGLGVCAVLSRPTGGLAEDRRG